MQITRDEYQHRLLINGKKLVNYRVQRVIGAPEREVVSRAKDTTRMCCPNMRVVRKYIPALAKVVDLPVPCGRCMWCRHKSQNKLIFRMYQHTRIYKNCLYITLTYDEAHFTTDPELLRRDITLWLKRLRKSIDDKTLSYYYVCEKGDLFDRPHFHVLLFWNGFLSKPLMATKCVMFWYGRKRNLFSFTELLTIDKPSQTGNVYVDYCVTNGSNDVSTAILSYVSKYLSDNTKHLLFRSWSHHLGYDVLSVDADLVSKLMYLRAVQYMPKDKVYTVSIPDYYKRILFTDAERACFFRDYLLSDEYKDCLDLCNSGPRIVQAVDNYNRYKERCEQAYAIRLKRKKARYYRETGILLD